MKLGYCLTITIPSLAAAVILSCASDNVPNKNTVPAAPTNLYATAISSDAIILNWQDNSDNESLYEVYRDQPVWNMITEVPADYDFFIDSLLQDSTFYSYFVIAVNDYGRTASAETVMVSTQSLGHPPDQPYYPVPFDGVVIQDSTVQLEWNGGDPDGDPVTYDLYFAMQSTPVLIDSNLTQRIYSIDTLEWGMTYFWQVAVKDNHRHVTMGPVWSFRVRAEGQ